jgi:hypothetical protein
MYRVGEILAFKAEGQSDRGVLDYFLPLDTGFASRCRPTDCPIVEKTEGFIQAFHIVGQH